MVDPGDPAKPLVIAGADLVHKVYDLGALSDAQRSRVRREADQAVALSALPGIVRAHRTSEVDRWLVIEMERAGVSLGAMLREASQQVPAAQVAKWIAQASETLETIHRRGVVHRDVKPDNLLFARDDRGILVADFSVVQVEGSQITADLAVVGTDRYIAPEQWQGLASPASDQYALAVTARDLLTMAGAPELTAPVGAVLAQGAAHDQADRYESIRAFGDALRRAVSDDAPRTLIERMMSVPAQWRYSWGPAACAAAAAYAEIFLGRDDSTIPFVEPLVYPLLAALVAAIVIRWTSGGRSRRSRSASPILDQVWLPIAITAALLFILKPILGAADEPSGSLLLLVLMGPLIGFAQVGAFPRRTGIWLPKLLSGMSMRLPRKLRRKRIALPLAVAALFVLGMGPTWAQRAWPREWESTAAAQRSPLLNPVLDVREALINGDRAAACRLIDRTAGCGPWLDRHRTLLLAERQGLSEADRRLRYADDGSDRLQRLSDGTTPVVSLIVPGRRLFVGSFGQPDGPNAAIVTLVIGAPLRDPDDLRALWSYGLKKRSGQWRIDAVGRCTRDPYMSDRPCDILVRPQQRGTP